MFAHEKGINASVLAARLLRHMRETVPLAEITFPALELGQVRDVSVDVRAHEDDTMRAVDAAVSAIGASLGRNLDIGIAKPPMIQLNPKLFEAVADVSERMGLPRPRGLRVVGGSDANDLTAAGVPTIDGLGSLGSGDHTLDEPSECRLVPRDGTAGSCVRVCRRAEPGVSVRNRAA